MGSTAFEMDRTDWGKVGKGGLVALAGAALAWLPDAMGAIEWGMWEPLAVAGGGVLANLLRKFSANNA